MVGSDLGKEMTKEGNLMSERELASQGVGKAKRTTVSGAAAKMIAKGLAEGQFGATMALRFPDSVVKDYVSTWKGLANFRFGLAGQYIAEDSASHDELPLVSR